MLNPHFDSKASFSTPMHMGPSTTATTVVVPRPASAMLCMLVPSLAPHSMLQPHTQAIACDRPHVRTGLICCHQARHPPPLAQVLDARHLLHVLLLLAQHQRQQLLQVPAQVQAVSVAGRLLEGIMQERYVCKSSCCMSHACAGLRLEGPMCKSKLIFDATVACCCMLSAAKQCSYGQ